MFINKMNYLFMNAMRHNQLEIYKSTARLSTGKKLAYDNPADILRSSRLESQIRGNVTGQQNIKDALDLLSVADQSLSYLEQMGQRLRELSNRYQTGTLTDTEKSNIQQEAKALTKEMSNIMSNSKYNNKNVFDFGYIHIQTGSNKEDYYEMKLPKFNLEKTESAVRTVAPANITIESRNVSASLMVSPMARAMALSSYGTTYAESETIQRQIYHSKNNESNVKPFEIPEHTITIPDQEGYTGFKKVYGEDGKLIYEGHFKNGQLDGYGQLYDEKGQLVYEGDFNKGVYDGFGAVFNDGKAIYRGDIKNGVANGYGTFFGDNGKAIYAGGLVEGYREGWGTSYNSDGSINEAKNYTDYSNGSSVTNPPVGGGETNPPDGNGNNNGEGDGTDGSGNGSDGGGTKPPSGGGDGNGNTQPPDDNGNENGSVNPPDGNGNGDGTVNPPDGNGNGDGAVNPPDGNGNGNGTVNPPDGNGNGNGTVNPPDGNGNGDGAVNPPDGNGNGDGAVNPPDGNGGEVKPPDIDIGDIGDIEMDDLLNNKEAIDSILDKISDSRGQIAIHESILERKLGFQGSLDAIQREAYGHIVDADAASELIAKSKHEMLLQMNAQLVNSMIEQEKTLMSTLLRSM